MNKKRKYNPRYVFLQLLTLGLLIGSVLLLFVDMSFWTRQFYILAIVTVLLILLSMVWPPDSPWSPWWKTSKQIARTIQKMAKITKKDIVYELGSGDAEALLTLAKEFDITCVGVEIDPIRHYQASIRVKRQGLQQKITLLKKNFFQVDLSPATVVYCYLIPAALKRLREKMLSELKPGTRVVSYRYTIDFLPLLREASKDKVYVYEVPERKRLRSKK